MVAELNQPFWAAWQAGEFLTDAAALAGTYRQRALAWLRQAGGVRPRPGRNPQGRYLSFAEREEIALGRAAGESMRRIAARLGRSPSTISRELVRNADRGRYRASSVPCCSANRSAAPTHRYQVHRASPNNAEQLNQLRAVAALQPHLTSRHIGSIQPASTQLR